MDNEETQEQMIERLVSERLKDIKSKLDNAYEARDTAIKELDAMRQKEREAELKRLEEEGKYKELYEAKLAEERKKNESLEQERLRLTRDITLKDILKTLEFKSSKAAEMAFSEIVNQLIQDASGNWVNKSGKSVADFVKDFAEDESNSFLFKQKGSSGPGIGQPQGKSISSGKKSLFEMTQAEVLQLAAEGKLPR